MIRANDFGELFLGRDEVVVELSGRGRDESKISGGSLIPSSLREEIPEEQPCNRVSWGVSHNRFAVADEILRRRERRRLKRLHTPGLGLRSMKQTQQRLKRSSGAQVANLMEAGVPEKRVQYNP
jgi:hypothetical protein